MPRQPRIAPGGVIYHVLNRGVGRMTLFDKPADYQAFEDILASTLEKIPVRLLGYCLMPNHWHLALWPRRKGELAAFMQRLSVTHASGWAVQRELAGTGHVYQGRFKSFPVQQEDYLLMLLRYIERNPLRARLVKKAENWRWGSLWRRVHGDSEQRAMLTEPPVELPRNWRWRVNQPESDAELESVRRCVTRGQPLGDEKWTKRTVAKLGLESTLRPRGRPRKQGGGE